MPRGVCFVLLLGRVPTQIRVFVCAPFRSPASHTQFVNAGLQGTALGFGRIDGHWAPVCLPT